MRVRRGGAAGALAIAGGALAGCALVLGYGDEKRLAGGDDGGPDAAIPDGGGTARDADAAGPAPPVDGSPPDGGVDAAPTSDAGGLVLVRVIQGDVEAEGSLLLIDTDGGMTDLGEAVRAANDAGSARSFRHAHLAPGGAWFTLVTDAFSAGADESYALRRGDLRRQRLEVESGPGLVGVPYVVEDPATLDDPALRVVFEAKADVSVDGGTRRGRWLYEAHRDAGAGGFGPARLVALAGQEHKGHSLTVVSGDGARVLSSCASATSEDLLQADAVCETTIATGVTRVLVRATDQGDAGGRRVYGPTYAADGTVVFVADNWPLFDNRERVWRLVGGTPARVSRQGDRDFQACALSNGLIAVASDLGTAQKLRFLTLDGAEVKVVDLPAGKKFSAERALSCSR